MSKSIESVKLQCMTKGSTTQAATPHIRAITGDTPSLAELLAFDNLGKFVEKKTALGLARPNLRR